MGTEFEIDLNKENASALREVLRPYIEKGRRSGGRSSSSNAKNVARRNTKTDPEQLKAIRAWAKENGYRVSDRGRISADVVAAYESAH